jgi:hypothetical protein
MPTDGGRLSELYAGYDQRRGGPPYDPRLMVRILLYGYTTGVRSSRKLEAACINVVAFRWLAAGLAPDFRAISRFRKKHLSALGNLLLAGLGRARPSPAAMRADAGRIDDAEDAKYGKDRRGDELPEDLRRTESRRATIRQQVVN